MAFAALLVAAPLVRCQEEDDEAVVFEDAVEEQPAAEEPVAAAAGGAAGGYADMATEYINKASEIAKPYVDQAYEAAAPYLDQAQVRRRRAHARRVGARLPEAAGGSGTAGSSSHTRAPEPPSLQTPRRAADPLLLLTPFPSPPPRRRRQEYLGPYLEKLGLKKGDKSEL